MAELQACREMGYQPGCVRLDAGDEICQTACPVRGLVHVRLGHQRKNTNIPGGRIPTGPRSARSTPAWSRDGKWIYFESNRDGSWQLYAWRLGSEEIRPLAVKDGRNPQESIDGEWLLYAADENIWRCKKSACLEAAEPGTNELLISGITEHDIYNWTPAGNGIYFIRRGQDSQALPELAFFNYADGNIKTLTTLTRDFRGWGMTLSPDESKLFFTEMAQPGSDIKVARP